MLRQIFAACCVLAAACGTANAGDRIFLHHGGMYVHSPVYVHPAYAVPVAPVVYSAPVWHYPAPVVVHPRCCGSGPGVLLALLRSCSGARPGIFLPWLPWFPSVPRRRN